MQVFLSTKKDAALPSAADPARPSDDLEASHLHDRGAPDTPLRPDIPRKRSRAGTGEEGRALFSAPEDEDDGEEMGGRAGKFEVGSDDEEDDAEEEKGAMGTGVVRRGSTGAGGAGNVWDDDGDGDGEADGPRRGLLS